MKTLTYVAPKVLEWREAADARIANDRDAIVRPIAVTRCDLDVFIASGAAGWPGSFALGHEVMGEVVDVGDAVRNVRPGDKVVVPFQISCGDCGRCRAGLTGLCESVPYRSSFGMAPLSGVEYGGGLADRMRVPFADHMLVPAPPGLTPEAMAGVADNFTTAYALLAEPLRQRPGASVLIVGGRGVSLHLVQCALALGADKAVFVDDDPEILALAARLGADAIALTVGPATPPVGYFPITIGTGTDPDHIAFAIRCTDYEGLCQLGYGGFRPRTETPLMDMYARNITLKLGRVHARAHMPAVLDLMHKGCLHPEDAITRKLGFADAADGLLDPTCKVVFVAE